MYSAKVLMKEMYPPGKCVCTYMHTHMQDSRRTAEKCQKERMPAEHKTFSLM